MLDNKALQSTVKVTGESCLLGTEKTNQSPMSSLFVSFHYDLDHRPQRRSFRSMGAPFFVREAEVAGISQVRKESVPKADNSIIQFSWDNLYQPTIVRTIAG